MAHLHQEKKNLGNSLAKFTATFNRCGSQRGSVILFGPRTIEQRKTAPIEIDAVG
jgi:hypothetical protein